MSEAMPDQINHTTDTGPNSRLVRINIRAKLVPGWNGVRPWDVDQMTEIGRRVVAAAELVPGVQGMDVLRYGLTITVAGAYDRNEVGEGVCEAVRPLLEN